MFDKRAAEIHVTNHCNLNCKGCSHFSPLVNNSFLENAKYRNELKSIRPSIRSYFTEIRLMGGEPLLHDRLIDVIQATREAFEKASIVVVTNGICIPCMNDAFWDCCLSNDVSMGITAYPINLDYSMLERIVVDHRVNCIMYGDRCGIKKFQKRPLSILGQEDGNKNYFNCIFTKTWSCMQIVGTRLYYCPTCAYIGFFSDYFGLNVRCDEYLDLAKIDKEEEIVLFLSTVKRFCRYCNLAKIENVDWGRSERKIEEWV